MIIKDAQKLFLQSLIDIGRSSNTIKSYQIDLDQLLYFLDKHFLGNMKIDDLTYPLISQFFQESTSHLAMSTQKRKRIVLKRFLRFCYQKKLCKTKVWELVDVVHFKNTQGPKEVLSKDEIQQIFQLLNQEIENKIKTINQSFTPNQKQLHQLYVLFRNRLLVYILLFTGCRAYEAVSIKKSNLKLMTNTLGIIAKGKKYNEIPIHIQLKYAFFEYENGIQMLQQAGYLLPESPWLFPSIYNSENHISTRTLYDFMLELSAHLERKIHAHLFRHTFASYSIAAGMNIRTLASIISHANPSITLSTYTHEIDAKQKQEEMQKLVF
ncbi:MAG: tyrosine-type recombinase/integrase [Epulopiscium sp.]|nr:tyrosine-type recombinase/integrase [Candidatus Epulonipiscium sp.]